ncbi:Hypothetical_protein [Hexamita inflata]|uniref:Hypothetical_protein n=1 Tax=Hexamita inflata TaxID=28002 RepID=A0AA86V9V4_9EUKA|nr:Hypothetical protein HINF_LOCUS48153 [Hexamita inflata]
MNSKIEIPHERPKALLAPRVGRCRFGRGPLRCSRPLVSPLNAGWKCCSVLQIWCVRFPKFLDELTDNVVIFELIKLSIQIKTNEYLYQYIINWNIINHKNYQNIYYFYLAIVKQLVYTYLLRLDVLLDCCC